MAPSDFSDFLQQQIDDLKDEMGVVDPAGEDLVEEVVDKVERRVVREERKQPAINYKKKYTEKKQVKSIVNTAKPKSAKQGSKLVYEELFTSMDGGVVEQPPQPEPQRVISESTEVKPFRKQVSVEELSKSMYQKYNNEVKDFEPKAQGMMAPATVKALADNISFRTKDDVQKEDFIMDNNMVVIEKMKNLQMQMNMLNTNFSALKEGTLVSGIGQGGDGQLPGGGEVQLKYMDDVSLDNIQAGDTLIWDPSNGGSFVPGAGGGGAGGAVDRLVAGQGIDISPVGGIGIVEIILDASITDLNDVADGMTPLNGDILVYNANRWNVGKIDTRGVALTNGTRFRNAYPRLTPGSYSTQEDANQLFAAEIDDLIVRINHIDGSVKPGLFLGLIDATVADNEPDDPPNELNPGDYFIHDGATGPLWGVGEQIDDKNSVVWTGAIWEVLTSSNTLAQLGDVTLSNPLNDHILVYDETNSYWYNKEPDFPTVTVGDTQPATGGEKKGDIFYNEDTSELFIYNDVWEKVSGGGGGSVKISADPPDPAVEGDLWVETDNWTILVYDGFNWVGLTNSGLINGQDPSSYVTDTELDDVVDSLTFVINQNRGTAETSLIAAVLALDTTHLRMEPQGPLTGPLTLSDDDITSAKQATTKEFVDDNFLNIYPTKSIQNSLTFQKGDDKEGHQFKISLNGDLDYATNIYSMRGGQMRFRTSHNEKESDHVGSHIVLDSGGGIPTTKIYHVPDPTNDTMAANKQYVDATAGTSVPVGSIMIWMNSDPPTGWFKLHGDNFNVNSYPQLHAYLQNTDGYSSGKLPDWSGYFPGEYGGSNGTGTLGKKVGYRTGEPDNGPLKSTKSFTNGGNRTANKAGSSNFAASDSEKVTIDSSNWDSVTRPNTILVSYIIKHD